MKKNTQNKKIYVIGIGGIGISAIARYYKTIGYEVSGSDAVSTKLCDDLISEGIDVIIGADANRIDESFEKIIYTEAIPKNQQELKKASSLQIEVLSYPEALGAISNSHNLIAVSGTHGKSTTSSIISIMLQKSGLKFSSVVGTLLKEFDGKNCSFSGLQDDYFVIESCEYKRSFLKYTPYIGVVLNIDLDHLDYYKDLADYISAFDSFISNIKSGGYAILNGNDENSKSFLGKRNNIKYIEIYDEYFEIGGEKIYFPKINLQIPGTHILFDAKVSFIVGYILGINNENILSALYSYTGVWRRMEMVKKTNNNNILISDYAHHPTEISLTLKAIKEANPEKKLFTVFQPHQYSRTIELLEDFKTCFYSSDYLAVPNIYESRDTEEDKQKISAKSFLEYINHPNKIYGKTLENTLQIIKKFDRENTDAIILLMGAGDVDNLRNGV